MYKRLRGALRLAVGVAVLVAALYGWLEFLQAPYAAWQELASKSEPNVTLRVLFELLNPESEIINYQVPFQGYLLLLLTFVVVFALFQFIRPVSDYLRVSRIPVSILEIKVTLCIDNEDMTEATIHREQVIHANRDDVWAYRSEHSVSAPNGTIGDFDFETFVGNRLVTKGAPVKRGNHRSWEIIEMFDRPLPQSMLATYLPNVWVYWLYRGRLAFQRTLAVRRSSMKYLNEYCDDRPMVQVQSLRYPVTNVVMEIDFPEATAPSRTHIQCILISENIVDELTPQRSTRRQGRCVYRVEVAQLSSDQKLRFQWDNERLKMRHSSLAASPALEAGSGAD